MVTLQDIEELKQNIEEKKVEIEGVLRQIFDLEMEKRGFEDDLNSDRLREILGVIGLALLLLGVFILTQDLR